MDELLRTVLTPQSAVGVAAGCMLIVAAFVTRRVRTSGEVEEKDKTIATLQARNDRLMDILLQQSNVIKRQGGVLEDTVQTITSVTPPEVKA